MIGGKDDYDDDDDNSNLSAGNEVNNFNNELRASHQSAHVPDSDASDRSSSQIHSPAMKRSKGWKIERV